MFARSAAFSLIIALAACGQPSLDGPSAEKQAPEELTASSLQIDIGRTGAMLGNANAITQEMAPAVEVDPAAPAQMARSLRETVWEYNLQRSKLCANGLYTSVSCGPAYEPVWISEPADAAPTLEELNSRNEALRTEVVRFEGAICDDARSKAPEAERMAVCPME